MGGLVDISKQLGNELGRSTSKSQMVVVCGNNKEAKQQLDGFAWGENVNVKVQGFVNNMDEWMKASDVLVTKAGPGTIAEASICGLPCMMFSFLYVSLSSRWRMPFDDCARFLYRSSLTIVSLYL